jgi:hypothetical protein
MATAEDIKLLFAEFPQEAISWRAQSVTKDGEKALALAYIDARDVMDRLDSVIGAADWQDRYEFHGSRTVCYLSIRVGDEWVTKADGAGDTDVEGEKGAISDALKRAAVKWGIGRYLYSIEAPWVPCESAEWNGKKQWKKWKQDPWLYIKGAKSSAQLKREDVWGEFDRELAECKTLIALENFKKAWRDKARKEKWNPSFAEAARDRIEGREDAIKKEMERLSAASPDELAELPAKTALEHSIASNEYVKNYTAG